MGWDVGLASMFKERDPRESIGPCIGKVVSTNPLKVSISNGDILLGREWLYISKSLLKAGLEDSDEVLLIPADGEQVFFIVDVFEKVGG